MGKICCVTGHREIPEDLLEWVRDAFSREIERAVSDGYADFLCGFARGADLLFASIAAERFAGRPGLRLIAVIPFRGRLDSLRKRQDTRRLLDACAQVDVLCEGYHPGVYARRNRCMVERSDRVIALYDGRPSGGTAGTVRLAQSMGREICLIPLPPGQA